MHFVRFLGSHNCLPDEKMALEKELPNGNSAIKITLSNVNLALKITYQTRIWPSNILTGHNLS